MLQLGRDRWRIESWHWILDTQLHENGHHDRGNGAAPAETRLGLRLRINPGALPIHGLPIDIGIQGSDPRRIPQLFRALPRCMP